jgi:hypothetical protein
MTAPRRYGIRHWLEGWAVIDLVTDRIVAEYPDLDQARRASDVWNGAAR